MSFDKKDYWFNRQATDKAGQPTPQRGQSDRLPAGKCLVQGRFQTVNIGIKKFKRSLGNPKKRKLTGPMLADLKAEGWSQWQEKNPLINITPLSRRK